MITKILLSTFFLLNLYAKDFFYEHKLNIAIDEKNKLMWQDNEEVLTYKETYISAKVYCENIVLSGYIDWRVPSINELQNIVDLEEKNSIYKEFLYVIPTMYRTKTLFKEDDDYIWVIDFKTGITNVEPKENQYLVRCVRDIL